MLITGCTPKCSKAVASIFYSLREVYDPVDLPIRNSPCARNQRIGVSSPQRFRQSVGRICITETQKCIRNSRQHVVKIATHVNSRRRTCVGTRAKFAQGVVCSYALESLQGPALYPQVHTQRVCACVCAVDRFVARELCFALKISDTSPLRSRLLQYTLTSRASISARLQ